MLALISFLQNDEQYKILEGINQEDFKIVKTTLKLENNIYKTVCLENILG